MSFAYYNTSDDIGYKINLDGALGSYSSDGNFQRFVPYNTTLEWYFLAIEQMKTEGFMNN